MYTHKTWIYFDIVWLGRKIRGRGSQWCHQPCHLINYMPRISAPLRQGSLFVAAASLAFGRMLAHVVGIQ